MQKPRWSFLRYLLMRRSKLRLWLVACGVAFLALGWSSVRPVPFCAGYLLVLAGMALHLISKGHLRQNAELTTSGPYRWVRNPFYLANLLIDLGLCLMINLPIFTLLFGIVWVVIYAVTIREEEKDLESLFGEAFRNYRKRVPWLIPWRKPLPEEAGKGRFSWSNKNISRGMEVPRLCRLASYPLFFLVVWRLRSDGLDFLTRHGGADLLLACAWAAVYWMAVVTKASIKERRRLLGPSLVGEVVRDVFITGFILAAFLIPPLGDDNDIISFGAGLPALALLAGAVAFLARRGAPSVPIQMLAECVLLVILAWLADVLWMGLLPFCYYSAAIAGRLLPRETGASGIENDRASPARATVLWIAPGAMCAAAVLLVALKELIA